MKATDIDPFTSRKTHMNMFKLHVCADVVKKHVKKHVKKARDLREPKCFPESSVVSFGRQSLWDVNDRFRDTQRDGASPPEKVS